MKLTANILSGEAFKAGLLQEVEESQQHIKAQKILLELLGKIHQQNGNNEFALM